jgi:aminoglycoside phosphotransferase (APT) family kinase protein
VWERSQLTGCKENGSMESITKNRQSTAVLAAMIARAYGDDQVPEGDDFAEELGHGWFNVAYRVRLRDGRRAVIKIAPPAGVRVMGYEREMMRNELAAIAVVREHSDVPVPPVDFADLSHELCDADWFAMPCIDAHNLGELEAEGQIDAPAAARLHEQLGAVTRTMNAIVGPHFGPVAGPGHATWRAAFLALIRGALDDGEAAGVDLGIPFATLRALIDADAHELDAVGEPRFVEWDLWASNALIRDGRIVAIIDHERAFYGDPLIEAGFTALDLPAFGDPSAFLRGYGADELTDAERRRRRLYTLYLVIVMIVETRYRGHTDPGQYDWARERMAELVAAWPAA